MSARQYNILITGGAGFIGSALVRQLVRKTEHLVVNIDNITYAGNLESLGDAAAASYRFEQADVCGAAAMAHLFETYRPDAIVHLAAESHAERALGDGGFRFVQISTDEVYGTLTPDAPPFSAAHPHRPNSSYAASKPAADHLARAWQRTFSLPVLTTNCSNNYGPCQFPEKLIPLCILNALEGKPLPIYGDGRQMRDWLYVEDHARALRRVLSAGAPGRVYCIGGGAERTNIAVIEAVCDLLDRYVPGRGAASYRDLIAFVEDRPGHDRRYAMEIDSIAAEFNWRPTESFESGLEKTVRWYLDNEDWCKHIRDGSYRGERLGLMKQTNIGGRG